MPLVFIHGVDNRENEEYFTGQKKRDALFRRYAFPGIVSDPETSEIFNPYWGGFAAKLAWNGASLPGEEKIEAFGSDAVIGAKIMSEVAPEVDESSRDPLSVQITKRYGLEKAIDAIWISAAVLDEKENEDNNEADVSEPMAILSADALAYAKSVPNPEWIVDVRSDEEFIDRLLDQIRISGEQPKTNIESFGSSDFRDRLKEGFSRLVNAIPRAGSNLVIKKFRPQLNDKLSRFLGDVFVYLRQRNPSGKPGPIASEIIKDLINASRTRSEKDPLIIVAHSMGGNIVYDILTSYHPEFECDVLVTVGSQVGLFEELKLFNGSNPAIPSKDTPLVAKPKNIKRWINVFDQTDVLSYVGEKIFEGIEDYEYNTGNGLFGAHSMYFYRPSFHQRLGERLTGQSQ